MYFFSFACFKMCTLSLEDKRNSVMMSFLSISRKLAFLSPKGLKLTGLCIIVS